MKKLKQLGLLMWKNFLLQRRRPVGTLVQIGLPFFMSLIYLMLRMFLIEATKYDALTWPAYKVSSLPQTLTTSFSIGYATPNGSHISDDFYQAIEYYLNNNTYHGQKINLQYFQSQAKMVNEIAKNSNQNATIGGIYFSKLPDNSNGTFEYTLRFAIKEAQKSPFASSGHEWLTKYVFPKFQLPQPRNKDSKVGYNPSYYEAGFLFAQYAVDQAIISKFGANQANIFMQKFPFPNYVEDGFILIIQQFMPNFFVIAFIYTALVIVRSIVYEKEKRLKVSLVFLCVTIFYACLTSLN